MEEIFQATVRGLSEQGLGVVDGPEGAVVFVPGTWPGDEGRFRLGERAGRYGQGELVELLRPSPQRQTPPCPHQGFVAPHCGGCSWMIARYEAQLEGKQARLLHLWSRAGLDADRVKPILPGPEPLGYRNRAQLKTDGVQLGFVVAGRRELAPVEDCLVLSPELRALFARLRASLPREAWRPSGDHPWNFLEIEEGRRAEDVVLNRRLPFRQANSRQNERMLRWVAEGISRGEAGGGVLELFSGSGNFTALNEGLGEPVWVAVEANADAVQALRGRNLPGVTALRADCYRRSDWKGIQESAQGVRTLLLDPPRDGFGALAHFVAGLPRLGRILYISCHPSSFVRDVRSLVRRGWRVDEVQPLDLFPQTPHLEVMGALSR